VTWLATSPAARSPESRRIGYDDCCTPQIGIALQPLQIGANFGSRLIAQLAVFLQRLRDDFFEL